MARVLRTVVLVCLLTGGLMITGCNDREKEEALAEAEEARTEMVKVKAALARSNRESKDLKEELAAVKETRNELQARIDQIIKEHGTVVAEAGNAEEKIKELTAQSDDQAKSVSTLQSELAALRAINETQQTTIDEQKATIEELQKTIEQLQGTAPGQGEPNEGPEEPATPSAVLKGP